jgi:ferredoxin
MVEGADGRTRPQVTDRNRLSHNGGLLPVPAMPVIRFLREGRDVECFPGENLREVALREGIELYGLKGKLGNCGGCGQCITCFVDVEGASPSALSGQTAVEAQKLRRRPQTWRLACQALVLESLVVLSRPQAGMADRDAALARALAEPLPAGPTAWPTPPAAESEVEEAEEPRAPAEEPTPPEASSMPTPTAGPESDPPAPSATSGEASGDASARG